MPVTLVPDRNCPVCKGMGDYTFCSEDGVQRRPCGCLRMEEPNGKGCIHEFFCRKCGEKAAKVPS